MNLVDALTLFASSFVVVFLLGVQSKNVMQSRYVAAMLTSLGISASNFLFVKYVSAGGFVEFSTAAAGGMLGIASAIYFYDRIVPRKRARAPLQAEIDQ